MPAVIIFIKHIKLYLYKNKIKNKIKFNEQI